MSRYTIPFVIFIAGGLLGQAGDAFKPGKMTKEEMAKLEPGLTLRFYSDDEEAVVDSRRVRLAALHVPEGGNASILVPAGKFKAASLNGLLKLPLGGDYQFKLVGTGDAVLRVNDKEVAGMVKGVGKEAGAVELVKGYNKIELRYLRPPKGDATVRAYWTGEGFTWEPLPPDLLFSTREDANLKAAAALRAGRLLFATHGCARCHGLPAPMAVETCQMPELKQKAPSLANAGNRFNEPWLASWIFDPRALRPEATMPTVLHGATAAQEAHDIAAYLMTLKEVPALVPGKRDAELGKVGEKLFFDLGCITCHRLQAPTEKDNYDRLSLSYAKFKFAPGALEAFLRAPQQHYTWSRMPDFKLTAEEANALAAYVENTAQATRGAMKHEPPSAERGAKLFASVGCAQCHTTKKDADLPKAAVAFPKLPVGGCLADDKGSRGKAPDFGFSEADRLALRLFLNTGGASLKIDVPAEFSVRQMKLLQCNACHNRDGQVSRWYGVLTEEGNGVQPEYLPRLTWVGEKLHPRWTEATLDGNLDHRARPWIKARMPTFAARAAGLAAGLSHEHGFALKEDPRPKLDPKLAALGEKLLPQVGGFNCVQCHAVGAQKAVAPFEAEGINLADAAVRLRYEYYARWMLDPTRVDPTTRMTKFTMDGKTTAIMDVLDGDARRQFDAIWQFMQTLPAKK